MYKRIEYIETIIEQQPVFGAALAATYTTGNRHDVAIDIGQPCIVLIPPINIGSFKDVVPEGPKFLSAMGWNKNKEAIISLEDIKNSGLSDKEVWSKITEYFQIIGQSAVNSLLPFYQYKGKHDTGSIQTRLKITNLCGNFSKVLFYKDPTGLIENVSSFDDLKNLKINPLLKKHRYACFVLEKMFEKSAADKIHNELCLLVSNLKNDYPYNRVYYTKDIYLPAPFLLDTISVCFYSLDDVMPVFDFKALTRSFCVEIILTNSELSPLKIHGGIGSLAITLLFSAGIDNVFEIDGEDIRGDDVRTINDIMILIQTIINSSISQRAAKSNKKSKSSTATEDYLCVV